MSNTCIHTKNLKTNYTFFIKPKISRYLLLHMNTTCRRFQTSRVNNSIILRIKNMKLSGYCFHMNTNISGDFQICISVPSRNKKTNDKFLTLKRLTLTIFDYICSTVRLIPEAYLEPSRKSTIKLFCDILKEAPP